jgi:membrane protease YdiL (CAAX protease family)
MRRLTRLLGDEEQRQRRGISTSSESARAFGDRPANVGADRTGATGSPDRALEQRGARKVESPTTITATTTPRHQLLGYDVTITGHLTSGGGADMVAVPIVLYNTDDPTNKMRAATTITDTSGHYRFTLTDSVASTHAYIVCAEGRSKYSRAQSAEVLVTYHSLRIRGVTRAALAPAFRARTVFLGLAWYELFAIFLILAGESLLFAGYSVLGVGVQALNIITVAVIVVTLQGQRVQLVEALALISVFRLVNLPFALVPTVTIYWLSIVCGVMYLPLISVIAHEKMSRYDLGIADVRRSVLLVPLGAVVGTGFAFIEHAILANEALIPNASAIELIQLSVVMIFFVALVEGLLFFVLLQSQLINRSGVVAGILIASVIFGAIHAGYANIYELLFATAAGVVLGAAFYKTRNLPFVITMTAANNILLFGVLPFLPIVALAH